MMNFRVLVKNNPRRKPPPREPIVVLLPTGTPLWRDPALWVSVLLVIVVTGGVLALGSYSAEYSADESHLAWATPEYPVGVLHTPEHAYVLGGGALSNTVGGFRVVVRPWGGYITPANGRGRMTILVRRTSHLQKFRENPP